MLDTFFDEFTEDHDLAKDINRSKKFIKKFREKEEQTLQDLYGPTSVVKDVFAGAPDRAVVRELKEIWRNLDSNSAAIASMHEEHEREVAPEVEKEVAVQRPQKVSPLGPIIDSHLRTFIFSGYSKETRNFANAFDSVLIHSSAKEKDAAPVWVHVKVTRDFVNTVESPRSGVYNDYFRPVNWVLTSKLEAKPTFFLISQHEVNQLLNDIRSPSSAVHLHQYGPRVTRSMQSVDGSAAPRLDSNVRPPRADGKDNKHHVKINKAKNVKVNLVATEAFERSRVKHCDGVKMHRRFPSRLDGLRGLPLFPKRPTSKPEENTTESSTPQHALDVNAMIPTPEGHKTESSTLQSAHEDHATITTPEGHKTESSTLQSAHEDHATITTPEGHKPESSTLQSAHEDHATIVNPEVNETESPFYDASETLAKLSATMVAPEDNETESAPVQGMELGVQADQTFPLNEHEDKLEHQGYERHRFGRDIVAIGERQQMQANADFAEAQSVAIQPGPMKAILLDDSRSVDCYELSPSVQCSLAAKGITPFTPLQEWAVEKLMGRPKGWYIERPRTPPNEQKTLEFAGAKEPKNLKEGESATEKVIEVKAEQDVLCLAETGAGKTLSYLLPLYEHLLVGEKVMNELKRQRLPSKHHGEIVQDSTLTPMARPFVLILVPTRELAIQVYNEMVDLSSDTWIQPGALYGGTSRKEQAAMLAHGCDILVGTPGRVIDIASWSYIDGVKTLSLDNLSHIVLDEADELLAISFAEQMLQILNLALVSGDLHYWFFSSQYMEEHINKAKLLMSSSHIDVSFDMPEENSAIRYALVKQNFIEVSEDRTERFDILMSILAQNKQTKILILCETHDSVEWLHSSLVALDIPFRSTHGGYSQERREEAILRFKRGTVPVLVSTMAIGGRGLNLQGVDCLIFWEMPESLDQYKWCLGRVGRLGNPAKAFVLATKDKNLKDDHRFANFFEVNDAEFDLDVDGNKIVREVEDDGWGPSSSSWA